jgi:ABC-type phosphate transport system permease subunit
VSPSESYSNEVSTNPTNSTSAASEPDSESNTNSKVWILGAILFLILTGMAFSRWIARRRR